MANIQGKKTDKKLFNGEGFCYNRFNVKTEIVSKTVFLNDTAARF